MVDKSERRESPSTFRRASNRALRLSEQTARKGWRFQRRHYFQWRSRLFMIVQIAFAAALAWWLGRNVLSHAMPFLAAVAATVCLGFSFGQRMTRVIEVAIGVTVGVAFGDLIVTWFGAGFWQIVFVMFAAMSFTTWLGARNLMVTQAGVQAAIVVTMLPGTGDGSFTRVADALVGCVVALAFATLAPIGPVDRPRLQAARVLHGTSATIRDLVQALIDRDSAAAEAGLEQARGTAHQLGQLTEATDEGMAVVRTSPFLQGRRKDMIEIADLTVPLDRFTRNLRVMARRSVAVINHGEEMPSSYLTLMRNLAQLTDECAAELYAGRRPETKVPELEALARKTSRVPIEAKMSSTVILAQIQSMVVDLLELCGLTTEQARAAIPD